eukprot:TRINITY_DN57868_c0_g1_i1.p1 TRINITY_DN57868_c0_g1~~TRINITY_DN57868_c0_g1_i1.p1  ORF type:complete len:444 (-),score=34.59 TRINITY_DN57868_c0_g1_i1:252-1583(-)
MPITSLVSGAWGVAAFSAIRNAGTVLNQCRSRMMTCTPPREALITPTPPVSPRRRLRRPRRPRRRQQQQAQLPRIISERPKWFVMILGWFLALSAGFVNAVSFLSWGNVVSHVSGGTTAIAMRVEGYHHGRHEFDTLGSAIAVLLSFMAGAFTCGLLIDKTHVYFCGKSLYGSALIGNAALLMVAVAVSKEGSLLSTCLTAMACGLQNAMCTSHFDAIIRTTHVTGWVTDIGSASGRLTAMLCRKRCSTRLLTDLERAEVKVDAHKIFVLLPMWCSFFTGGVLGTYVEPKLGVSALMIPAFGTLFIGMTYMSLRERMAEHFKTMEHIRLVNDVEKMNVKLQRAMVVLKELRRQSLLNETHVEGDADSFNEENMVFNLVRELGGMLETMRGVKGDVEQIRGHTELSSNTKTISVREFFAVCRQQQEQREQQEQQEMIELSPSTI